MSVSKQIMRTELSEFKFKNPQVSVANAVEYMKKLTVVAVSSVLYIRDVFPPTAFSDRRIDDMKIKVLKGLDDVPGSKTMIAWIKNAFIAVESHYLKKMVIVIEKGDEMPFEAYTFTFDYKRDVIICNTLDMQEKIEKSQEVPQDIKKATQKLLRSILLTTQSMEILPDDAKISMRLEFNDYVPDDFELPEHFKVTDSLGIIFPVKPQTFKMGKVETKYTSIAMSTKFIVKDQSEVMDEAECDEIVNSSQPQSPANLSFTRTPLRSTQADKLDTEREASHLSETLSSVRLRGVVQCVCGSNDVVDNNLQCAVCGNNQHRACYKIMGSQTIHRHICVECHDPRNPGRTCTDPTLVDDQNRKEGALYRRALVLCLTTAKASPNTFISQLNTSRQAAQQIYNRLDNDGCLHPQAGRGKNRIVNTENIKDILGQYFNLPKKDDDIAEMDTEENHLLCIGELNSEKTRKRPFDMDDAKENNVNALQGKRKKFRTTMRPIDCKK